MLSKSKLKNTSAGRRARVDPTAISTVDARTDGRELAETLEEVADGIGAGKALHAQQRVQSFVGAQPVGVSQTGQTATTEMMNPQEGSGWRDGVGACVGGPHLPDGPHGIVAAVRR